MVPGPFMVPGLKKAAVLLPGGAGRTIIGACRSARLRRRCSNRYRLLGSDRMLQITRYAHRLGLALLLAGVLAPVAIGVLPGLLLAAITGCFLLLLRGGFVQQRWLQLHLLAALVVMAVVVLVLLPVTREVAALVAEGGANEALLARERLLLWLTGGLVLAVAAIGYFKPRLQPRR
jgi:hypothetical protein